MNYQCDSLGILCAGEFLSYPDMLGQLYWHKRDNSSNILAMIERKTIYQSTKNIIMNTTIKVFSGFMVGAMAGAVAGLLFAPRSGKKTRKELVKQLDHFKDDFTHDVEERFDHLKEEYNERLGQLSDLGKKGIDKIKDKASVN